MTSSKMYLAAKETKSSVIPSWLIKQLDGKYKHIVAEFIMITSMLLIILQVNNSTCFIITPHKITEFIVKFGYNARCHWLKERALWEYRA